MLADRWLWCLIAMAVACSEEPTSEGALGGQANGTSLVPSVQTTTASGRTRAGTTTQAAVIAIPEVPPPLAKPPIDQTAPTGRILVDVSGSMKGFAQGGPAALESVLRAIKDSLGKAGVSDFDACDVSSQLNLKCQSGVRPERYTKPQVFEGRSRIAATLASSIEGGKSPDGKASVSGIDGRDVSVVVTDGLEVSTLDERTAAEIAVGCQKGVDTFCFQNVLASRLAQHYGIWMITVSLRFKGRIFAERTLDAALLQRMQDHLSVLKARPDYATVAVEATPKELKGTATTEKYDYTGVRSLILFVLSKRIDVGRAVTNSLVNNLMSERVAVPDGSVSWVEIGPNDTGVSGLTAVEFPRQAQTAGWMVTRAPRRTKAQEQVATVACSPSADFWVSLRRQVLRPPEPPLPMALRRIEDVKLAGAFPEMAVSAPTANEQKDSDRFFSHVRCLNLSLPARITYELGVSVKYGAENREAWWWQANADNSYEMPEKIFRIGELVESLLKFSERPRAPHDSFVLDVVPE